MKRTEWGQELETEFARLYRTLSPEAVAVIVGRSLRSIYSKAHKMGLTSGAPKAPGRVAKPKPKLASRPRLPAAKTAPPSTRGPGYQSGEPVLTAQTRFTLCPSMPQPTKSNTFSSLP